MIAAGALFYSKSTGRFLFLLRNKTRTKNTWGMPGGKLRSHENIIGGLTRELTEELGKFPNPIKTIPLETFTSVDGVFQYYSFIFIVENEFLPNLNNEHGGYAWASLDKVPRPLHPELFQTISLSVIRNKIKLIEKLV